MSWQPIETAPTDDTLFLAGWPDGRMAVLRGSILAAQKNRKTPTPEHLQFQCTHWMPLPEPPRGHIPPPVDIPYLAVGTVLQPLPKPRPDDV